MFGGGKTGASFGGASSSTKWEDCSGNARCDGACLVSGLESVKRVGVGESFAGRAECSIAACVPLG